MAPALRPLLVVAAVAGVAAIVAAWLAPAVLVDSRLAQITGGRVRLTDTEGTVWRARANLVAGTATMPIAWRLEAWPLLRGELRVHLVPDTSTVGDSPRAGIAIAGDRVSLRDVDASFPAALFAAAAGAGTAWGVGGDVRVNATAMDWMPPSSNGEARVQWRQARLAAIQSTASLDLGDVSIPLKADGDRLFGTVSNDGGDLSVRGDIVFRAADGVAISLLLTPRRVDDVDLTQVLSVLGTAEGGGWRIHWKQPLR
jgi:Type II secretion system (T2SS), protein N